jgi:hypothetical protein
MNIEQKLEALAKESLQLRFQLVIKEIQLFAYYQLALLNNQIEKQMEILKQKQDDLAQDEEKTIQSEAKQIEQTKDRGKRSRLRIERTGGAIIRTELK